MIKAIKNVIPLLLFLILILFIVGFSIVNYWSRISGFYDSCERIEIGMSEEDAMSILSRYVNSDGYTVSTSISLVGQGIFISSNFTGDECDVLINDGEVVKLLSNFE